MVTGSLLEATSCQIFQPSDALSERQDHPQKSTLLSIFSLWALSINTLNSSIHHPGNRCKPYPHPKGVVNCYYNNWIWSSGDFNSSLLLVPVVHYWLFIAIWVNIKIIIRSYSDIGSGYCTGFNIRLNINVCFNFSCQIGIAWVYFRRTFKLSWLFDCFMLSGGLLMNVTPTCSIGSLPTEPNIMIYWHRLTTSKMQRA